jgi:competence protein ComEC
MVAGGVGTYVVAANLVAAPFAAPVTIVGLVAIAVAEPLPWLGHALVAVAAALVRPVDVAAQAFASAPGAWLPWPATAVAAASLAVIAALLIAATASLRVRGWGLAAVALMCALSLAAPTALTAVGTPRMREWEVVACDVGQGDMMLLRSAPDSAVVIDVGAAGAGGEQCLRRHGVQRIELLIVTHPDADHDGNMAAVLASVPVAAAWVSPVAADAPSTRLLERRGVAVTIVGAGIEARVGSVHLRVLGPGSAAGGMSDNEASVVVLAQAGGTSVIGLGDLEREGQQRLVASLPRQLVVDVIKIAHHGSENQHEALAGRLTGRVGIVSVGADNTYGHPHPRTVDLYRPRTSVLLRTDQCGDILMASAPVFRFASRCPANVAG